MLGKSSVVGVGTILCVAFSLPALGLAISVDGDLSDWGVTAGTDWDADLGVASLVEDYVGYGSSAYVYSGDGAGYVGPGYGGQDFDMEAMYLLVDGDSHMCYLAISTGVEQAGSQAWNGHQGAGDVFFDFGLDSTWDTAVIASGANAGQLWTGFSTINAWPYPQGSPWVVSGGTSAGAASFVYADDASAADHNVIELAYLMSDDQWAAFMAGGVRAHWTMQCGNDIGEVTFDPTLVPPSVVPEPSSCALMGLGLACVLMRRKLGA